ncbi:hypothetical protein TNCV_4559951 [Trichonephila clavipes]|nr:hypothetical protein TNCV_4559951 [Trichonephila clavipes]
MPVWQCQAEGREIHRGKGLDIRLSLSVALSIVQVQAQLHPNFEGESLRSGQFPPTNLTRGIAIRRLFRIPLCRKGTTHLKTSMRSLGFETRPNGTAVSVTNHYTGWATQVK